MFSLLSIYFSKDCINTFDYDISSYAAAAKHARLAFPSPARKTGVPETEHPL